MITPAALDAAYRAQPEAAVARRRAAPLTIAAQTRAMLAWMKTHAGGRLGASEVGRTWIWSDLHLDHAEVRGVSTGRSRPRKPCWSPA